MLAGDWTHDDGGGDDDDDDFTVGGPALSCSAGCHSQQRYMVNWALDTDDGDDVYYLGLGRRLSQPLNVLRTATDDGDGDDDRLLGHGVVQPLMFSRLPQRMMMIAF